MFRYLEYLRCGRVVLQMFEHFFLVYELRATRHGDVLFFFLRFCLYPSFFERERVHNSSSFEIDRKVIEIKDSADIPGM
jgi:hypothetical protein